MGQRMSNLPDFSQFCEAACIKLWGEPDKRTKKELRWTNGDAYGARTYTINKRAWYDHGAERGGSTLELLAYSKGLPNEKLRGRAFFDMWQALHDLGVGIDPPPSPKLKWPVLATYPYHDEQSVLLFEVVRFDTSDPDARFKQRRPDGKGGWIWDLKGVRRVLYRLPELIAAVKAGERIILTEGERDANTAVKLGYAATTMPGGVEKWVKEYDNFFVGADVIVVSDNDPQSKDKKTGKLQFHPDGRPVLKGQDHAEKLAKRLAKVAVRVRKIIFDEVKDLSEWVERSGGTREQMDALIEQAPEYQARHDEEKPEKSEAEETPQKEGEGTEYMKKFTDLACNVGNVILALKQEPELMNAFGYDEMLRAEVLLRPLFCKEPNFKARPATDADVSAVQSWLQWKGFRKLGSGVTHEAVNAYAREHSFHPVRDYLERLCWDGKPRVRTWLHKYLGAEDNEYTNEIGTMFLIGMVARMLNPGCKLDYMLVLEGGQGTTRSTVCAILAGEYFSDHMPPIKGKECSQHLRGKWLIEVAELRAQSGASVDEFKEFLSRQIERYRPPWGKKEVHEPRQCAFVGTTNKDTYLHDETGNRRFWPVKVGEIDLDALRRDRDQLFAEAVALFRADVHWWPDAGFEQQHIVDEQETRFEVDAWEPLIKDYLNILHLPKRTTLNNIAVNVLGYEIEPPLIQPQGQPQEPRKTPINRFGTAEQRRVTAILRHLGWVAKRDNRERWWEPGPNAKTR
jgi:predicted P-loop ATPase